MALKEERYVLPVERKRPVRRETNAVSGMKATIVHRHRKPNRPCQRQKPVWEVQPTAVQILVKRISAECPFVHWKVEEQPNKKPRKMKAKVQLLSWKVYDSWVVYHRTLSRQILQRFLGRAKECLEPIRRVRFTRAALRQVNIREKKGPSLGKIQVLIPQQRRAYAMKFEDRSPGETARQERCARPRRWELAKKIYKLKKEDKATFCSPSEWVILAASTIKPEERVCGIFRSKHAHGQQKRP